VTYTVRFSLEAQDQLDELESFISMRSSAVVAADYVDAIVAYCESLETFPERGIRRDDLMDGLRITNFRHRVVIAFLVDVQLQTVSIVGVFYGGRDYEALLSD
jgi:plasmid stabilization system protein ParE